jgi:hypothetical protein
MDSEVRRVAHPQFGEGQLLKTYMSGYEWEVQFDNGRRFRLPAKEFASESLAQHSDGLPAPRYRPSAPLPETDQFRARQTLEALRMGIVPVRDAQTLTIGLEAERVTLDRALIRAGEGSGDVLAIIGNYGFGKSHFIEIAAQRALQNNMLVAGASLDLIEVPPGKAHKIYEALVGALRYPDTSERGLYPLIRKALDQPGVIDRLAGLTPREVSDCPLTAALFALRDCGQQTAFDDIVLWLSGQIKPTSDLKSCLKKPPHLYINGENARQYTYLLSAISTLATLLGYTGLAVLIDESEHYSLLRAAQRERADSFFKGMIVAALGLHNGRIEASGIPEHHKAQYDISFASEPHLFFAFALTESENRMPVGTWLAPVHLIRLDDRFTEPDIAEFFKMVLRYHALAHDYKLPKERYQEIVRDVPALLAQTLRQHRLILRDVIRTSVAVCDLLYLHADYAPESLLADLKRGLKV